MAALVTFLAFIGDWILGDPQRWPHPVRAIGRLIGFAETDIRRTLGHDPSPERLRLAGACLALGVVATVMVAVALVLALASAIGWLLWFLAALYLVYSALCLKDLYYQTWRVEQALRDGFLDEARRRLSWVVGRDTEQLDEAGIRRAVIETLAENFADGLVAPLFYLALGGPVLAWGYKAVNTLDSMIGYKNEKYLHLGRFAAKLDDAANFIPARLAALLLVATARLRGFDWLAALRLWQRDGRLHSSPNSGHPEAAMAGALGLWLGGPSYYGGELFDKPKINAEGGDPGPESVRVAEELMIGAAIMLMGLVVVLALTGFGQWGWWL